MRNGVANLLAAGSFCLLFTMPGAAQLDTPEALNSRAVQAYQSKDYATFLVLEKQIHTLGRGDPRTLYNIASGEALTGHSAEALQQLDRLLAMHLDFDAAKDPDFAGIIKTPEWAQYLDHLAVMRKPVVSSSVAFTLPEKGLLASSIAVDEARGDSYIGCVRGRKILKRAKDGVVSEFATEKEGLLSVSSLLIDPVRNQLLAGTAALPYMQNFRKEDAGKASIAIFDLSTGKLIRSAFLSGAGEHHVPAQMVEDSSGTVFVVDTGSSEIRRMRRSSSELELFLSSVVFRAPRGVALSADERTLYVEDGATGLWAIDVLSIDRTHVDVPADVWLGGMVGLARVADGFISLQTGTQPNRVVKIEVDVKGEKVKSVKTLESNHPLYEGPMPGTLTGNEHDWLYVADSQLDLLDPKTNTFPADKAKETVVLRLPVGK